MRDELHDAIDAQEELGERAQAVVEAIRPRLPALMRRLVASMDESELNAREGADIVEEALELIAAAVEAQLAPLTTEAVRTGANLARARRRVTGIG
jgi:hypothetical protein